MIVQSDLLGTLSAEPEEVIEFSGGLFGFPEARSFLLLEAEKKGMYWLQSIDHGPLVFLLVDPFPLFSSYSVEIQDADAAELEAASSAEIAILSIVTLPRSSNDSPTANLQGPLALNLRTRRGKQLVVAETEFGVRCPFSFGGVIEA